MVYLAGPCLVDTLASSTQNVPTRDERQLANQVANLAARGTVLFIGPGPKVVVHWRGHDHLRVTVNTVCCRAVERRHVVGIFIIIIIIIIITI
jgi:hypothetical protein